MAITTSIYLSDEQQNALMEIAKEKQIMKKGKMEYSLTETLKYVLDEFVRNRKIFEKGNNKTDELIEQIHATLPHIMFQATLACQASAVPLDRDKKVGLRNTSMDITVETCGQFQEVSYEEITTSLDSRNIKSLPIDKDKNQWK